MPTTIDNLLSRMTLEEKIGQMILASIEVSRMDAGTREFLRKNHIGNVILFGKNCAGRAALAQLNAEIQHTVMAENGLPALIAIDQEGGIGLANEFAKALAQKQRAWEETDWIKYKPRFFPAPWSLPARAIPPTPTKLGV